LDLNSEKPIVTRPRIFYGWYVVAASWIMSFLVAATGVAIFFKPILDEFGWDRATLSLASSVAMVIFAALSPLLGRLIDRFGARLVLFTCVVSQSLSSVSTGIATGLAHFYIGRFLYEMKPTHSAQVLINRWFVRQRGKALGILSSGTPLGTLLLSPLSQYLVLIWGWRPTILFWAGVTALVGLPLLFLIRNKPEDLRLLPDGDLPSGAAAGRPMIVEQSGAVADQRFSLKQVSGYRSFWLLTVTQFFCGIGCGLMTAHVVIFATDLGYSALVGATFLSVQGGMSLVGVLVTGPMSDKISRSRVLALTHLIRGVSFITIVAAVALAGNSLGLLYLGMAFFGFGWFTTAPLAAGLIADLFGYTRIGTIIGVILASHGIGTALGIYAGGITFQITGSYLVIFMVVAMLELVAAFFAFIIKKPVAAGY
jgi:MFS family permease